MDGMSHKHHEETTEELLKKLIVLTCDLLDQGQVQILQNRHIVKLLSVIAAEDAPPYLATIQLLSKGSFMPNPGPITLVSAGETDQTVIVALDQFGQPFTGPIPAATYASDNDAAATVDSNGLVSAVANGNANVSASLTTAEGAPLSASLAYIVDIPAPVPVLTSFTLQSNHA
jgi:hypothetical protein